jgi:transcriptional regulator with XRE-family HTH domain
MANNVRGFRESRRMTLDELARRTKTDPGLLSKVERSIIRPSARVRRLLSECLETPDFILFPPDDQEKRT